MKKLALVAALASVFGAAHAGGVNVNSSSLAVTGSASVSGVVGNGYGYSMQKSGAEAFNTSSAYAITHPHWFTGGSAATGAASHGATASYVVGVNVGSAFGVSGALAKQHGEASAIAGGAYLFGAYGAASHAEVGSKSVAANVNNGVAINGTETSAHNESDGGSKIVKLWPFTKSTFGGTHGQTTSESGSIVWGAFGATNGYATQHGVGGGL